MLSFDLNLVLEQKAAERLADQRLTALPYYPLQL